MKITKYEHACFVVEENDESLIVDPGAYTGNLVVPDNVVGVFVTHEHGDHLNIELLREIIDKNPLATIYSHHDIVAQLGDFNKTQTVVANEGIKIGSLEVTFHGGQHAKIFEGKEEVINLGIMVNNRMYYPGDSFYVPDTPVEILALPVSAPWLKISEVIDFLTTVKPKLAFPTHDAILSDTGKNLVDNMLPPLAQKVGTEYRRLREPLEI